MKPESFFDRYDAPPPWDIGRPQPAIEPLSFSGRVLDVGCGTDEHALLAASRGLEATGVDGNTPYSPTVTGAVLRFIADAQDPQSTVVARAKVCMTCVTGQSVTVTMTVHADDPGAVALAQFLVAGV